MNTSLLKVFTPKIRRAIRNGLTYNWAGGYQYSYLNGAVIERAQGPSIFTWDSSSQKGEFYPAPPARYTLITGHSTDLAADFAAGRRLKMWGRSRGARVPKYMMGVYNFKLCSKPNT